MHDDLNSFKQKPTQKFCEKLINFEKPQIFQKNPKSYVKKMKCMISWVKMRSYQRNKKIFRPKNF